MVLLRLIVLKIMVLPSIPKGTGTICTNRNIAFCFPFIPIMSLVVPTGAAAPDRGSPNQPCRLVLGTIS